jgi:polyferredoxin
MTPDPVLISKFVLWLAVIVLGTALLVKGKMNSRVRLAFIVGGVLVFGVVYGLLTRGGLNPNPVSAVRNFLAPLIAKHELLPLALVMLVILLVATWVSNKSICAWGCQIGLLQDWVYRLPLKKWNPRPWISNSWRIVAFTGLVAGLALKGLDWIGVIDPFGLFSLNPTPPMIAFAVGLLVASAFVYRPWCRFLCPFGLLSWVVEQVSLLRPRIDRDLCRGCRLCVEACPGQAMSDIYADKPVHADCFACGACIEACPAKDALGWRIKAKAREQSDSGRAT